MFFGVMLFQYRHWATLITERYLMLRTGPWGSILIGLEIWGGVISVLKAG